MKRKFRLVLGLAGLAIFLALANVAFAGSGFDLAWHSVAGGGGTSSGSGYVLTGTDGQMASGVSSGNGFSLQGGFWQGNPENRMYLPIIRR